MLNVLNLLDSMISKANIQAPKTQEETLQNDALKTTDFKDILDSFTYKQHSEKDKVLKDINKIFQDIFSFFQNITNTLSHNIPSNDKNQGTNDVSIKLTLDNNTKNFAVGLLKDIEKLSKDINPNFNTNTIENIIKNIQNPKSNETFFISISIHEEIIKTSTNASSFLDSILSNLDKHILSQKDISSHISSISFSLILEKENISETLISLKAQKVNLDNMLSQIKPFKDIETNSHSESNIKTLEEPSQKDYVEIPIKEDASTQDNTTKNQSDENIADSLNNYQAKSTEKDLKESDIPSNKIISKSMQTNRQVEDQHIKREQLGNTENISYKSENIKINVEINDTREYQLPKDYTPVSTQDEKATDIHTKDTQNKDVNQPKQTKKEYEQIEQDVENNKASTVKNAKNLNNESISDTNTKIQAPQKQESNGQIETANNRENNPTIAKEPPTSNNPTTLNKET
ncbi:MAG: hypothetical protein C0170_04965, partial [Hydrogenobaculum sp.]